jgi:hypothetical protein
VAAPLEEETCAGVELLAGSGPAFVAVAAALPAAGVDSLTIAVDNGWGRVPLLAVELNGGGGAGKEEPLTATAAAAAAGAGCVAAGGGAPPPDPVAEAIGAVALVRDCAATAGASPRCAPSRRCC